MMEQLVFGAITRVEAERQAGLVHEANPCIAVYGRDPMGRSCKYCGHLFAKRLSKIYWKCDLRKVTAAPGTDHRVKWPACGRYERRPGT